MSPSQIIVLATPVFLLMIAAEYIWSRARGLAVYRLNDAINSISLGVVSQLSGLFTKLLAVGIYTAVYHAVAPWPDLPFWSTWYGVLLALVFYDFCYYWLHRAGHEVAVFWARTWCTTRARPTTCPPRCARPAAAPCWAGSSTCRWRLPACRRW